MENNFNLAKIIKGNNGCIFFCVIFGDVTLSKIRYKSDYPIAIKDKCGTDFYLDSEGKSLKGTGLTVLFPDRESYAKYPMDAEKAWYEWQLSNKPKAWRAKQDERFFWIDLTEMEDNICQEYEKDIEAHNKQHQIGNYFQSEELAKMALKEIVKTLDSFHDKYDPKPEEDTEEDT